MIVKVLSFSAPSQRARTGRQREGALAEISKVAIFSQRKPRPAGGGLFTGFQRVESDQCWSAANRQKTFVVEQHSSCFLAM